jgi:hypothetical protein
MTRLTDEKIDAAWYDATGGSIVTDDMRAFARAIEQAAIAAFLERTGRYVTNDASREAAIREAVLAERERAYAIVRGDISFCTDNARREGRQKAARILLAKVRGKDAA